MERIEQLWVFLLWLSSALFKVGDAIGTAIFTWFFAVMTITLVIGLVIGVQIAIFNGLFGFLVRKVRAIWQERP